ncbi:MAG: thioredoxin domain-containing protein [Parcubacteria group bacterium]|jgi:protein-disulfide isomerase
MGKFMEKYSIPAAIMVAGLFVAGAVLLSNFYGKKEAALPDNVLAKEEIGESFLNALPVSESDHILGSKDAKIKVVTYADMECPYCIDFESTMRTIVSDYNGQVAWVFRHFPLDFHENAEPAAIASECVADISGEDSFWQFMQKFASDINASKEIDVKAIAVSLGINAGSFTDCYNSDKPKEKIDADYSNGFEAGLEGTPYSVIFADGKPVDTIDGAYPLEDVKAAIDSHL